MPFFSNYGDEMKNEVEKHVKSKQFKNNPMRKMQKDLFDIYLETGNILIWDDKKSMLFGLSCGLGGEFCWEPLTNDKFQMLTLKNKHNITRI